MNLKNFLYNKSINKGDGEGVDKPIIKLLLKNSKEAVFEAKMGNLEVCTSEILPSLYKESLKIKYDDIIFRLDTEENVEKKERGNISYSFEIEGPLPIKVEDGDEKEIVIVHIFIETLENGDFASLILSLDLDEVDIPEDLQTSITTKNEESNS